MRKNMSLFHFPKLISSTPHNYLIIIYYEEKHEPLPLSQANIHIMRKNMSLFHFPKLISSTPHNYLIIIRKESLPLPQIVSSTLPNYLIACNCSIEKETSAKLEYKSLIKNFAS